MVELVLLRPGESPSGNGPWREIGAARAWLEAQGFRRRPERPEWKWERVLDGVRARLRYRAHYGFFWEFRASREQESRI